MSLFLNSTSSSLEDPFLVGKNTKSRDNAYIYQKEPKNGIKDVGLKRNKVNFRDPQDSLLNKFLTILKHETNNISFGLGVIDPIYKEFLADFNTKIAGHSSDFTVLEVKTYSLLMIISSLDDFSFSFRNYVDVNRYQKFQFFVIDFGIGRRILAGGIDYF
ncbi:hypothetical protein CL658_03935 [bacterium]|nr:hypothetical protein [bacterium]|tara:strand:- start:1071 stop:1550 length:480 start_codon:yes stop_codon:yes gene_type:complete